MVGQRKATELLREDHKAVLRKLDGLGAAIAKLDSSPDLSSLNEYGRFFKKEIWAHFAKEEEALFPEIEKFLPREGGPTGVMLMEHNDLRKANERFQAALGCLNEDLKDIKAKDTIRKEGSAIIYVLRGHIDKENNILFMMADMHLDSQQNKRVLELFQKIDQKYAA